MRRIGVAAEDPLVSEGLRRLFGREPEVEVVRLAGSVPTDSDMDVVILDVWPPAPGHAEALCAQYRRQHPGAAIVAIVHRPTPALLKSVRRSGGTALWPKDEMRALPHFALDLAADRTGAVR